MEEKRGAGQVLFGGVPLRPGGVMAAAERVLTAARDRRGGYVCTVNATMLTAAQRDKGLREALLGALFNTVDGLWVWRALAFCGHPGRLYCPGVELGEAVLARAADEAIPVGFYGGAPGVAVQAAEAMKEKYPDLIFSLLRHGFDPATPPSLFAAAPPILFVCLGSPRQEKEMRRLSRLLPGTVMLGLGGSLDVYAQRVRRAPKALRRAGLEGLFRCFSEPRRFLRLHPFAFLRLVLHEKAACRTGQEEGSGCPTSRIGRRRERRFGRQNG